MKIRKLIASLTIVVLLISTLTGNVFAAEAEEVKATQPKEQELADVLEPPAQTPINIIINYYKDNSENKENFLGTYDMEYTGKAGADVVLSDKQINKFLEKALGYEFDKLENTKLTDAKTPINVIYKKSEIESERVLNVYAHYPLSDKITHVYINYENWDKYYSGINYLTKQNVVDYYKEYQTFEDIIYPYYENYRIYGRATLESKDEEVALIDGKYDVTPYASVSVALTYGSYRYTVNHHFNDEVVKGTIVKGITPTLAVSTDLGADFPNYTGYTFEKAQINKADVAVGELANITLKVEKGTTVDLYYTKKEEEVIPTPIPNPPYNPPYEPQETIIVEEVIPLAEIPEEKTEIIEIVDEDIPLGKLPQSGGLQALGFGGAGISALLAGVLLTLKKKFK